jgi:hypothetical protein
MLDPSPRHKACHTAGSNHLRNLHMTALSLVLLADTSKATQVDPLTGIIHAQEI